MLIIIIKSHYRRERIKIYKIPYSKKIMIMFIKEVFKKSNCSNFL